jgi:hypothetical protein
MRIFAPITRLLKFGPMDRRSRRQGYRQGRQNILIPMKLPRQSIAALRAMAHNQAITCLGRI